MLAVMKTAPGIGNVELREIPEPTPEAGQVKIAVQATGICGTDLHIERDEFPTRPPVVMGHEIAGVVSEVGAGVDPCLVGVRVTTETYFFTCGRCRFCRAGAINLCPERRSLGSAVNGGFASHLVVPAANIHPLPASVDSVAGALTEPLACVVHGALERPTITAGDLAVVSGPGTIGLLTSQVVKAAGATVVLLGTAADQHRLHLGRTLGADYTVSVDDASPRVLIDELTGGIGADIVIECAGAGPSATTLLELVRRNGQYAQIGLFGRPIAWDLDQVCYKELSVTGSNASVPSAWATALRLLADGRVRTRELVTDIVPLTGWRTAFDRFETRDGVKFVLQPVAGG